MSTAPQHRHTARHTWDDYRRLPNDQRWELIDGDLYAMSPAPGLRHQDVSRELTVMLATFFAGKTCVPYAAPIDVRLTENTVVQPDLIVVGDRQQFRDTHIAGPPALVVEILSAGTYSHDYVRKLELYAAAGVKEYWLINPYPHVFQVLVLDQGHYRMHADHRGRVGAVTSPAFPGLEVSLSRLFDFPVPPEEQSLEVHEAELEYFIHKSTESSQV